MSPTKNTLKQELDPKHHTFLRKLNFDNSQLSPQKLLNFMQLLCDFQDVYSQHEYDFGAPDIPFHITLKPDAKVKKQHNTKNPTNYRGKIKKMTN